MHTHILVLILMYNLHYTQELGLPMYNVHPYFPLKNLGKKSVHYTQRHTVNVKSCERES